MHRNWKKALLGDSTHSVADMIVHASTSLKAFLKTHLMARSYHGLVKQKQVSRTVFPLVAVGVIHPGFHAFFGQA